MALISQKLKMNKTKNTLISALLVVLLAQNLFPAVVFAAKTNYIPSDREKELTISESPAGKLFYIGKSVKKPSRVVMTVLTAYSSTPDQTDSDPFVAASGKRVYDGMVAANWLPFGTKIKIPSLYGNKVFTVDDRMNPRYGYGRMDIWMDAPHKVVGKFGVKRAEVEVYFDEPVAKMAGVENY